MLMNAVQPVHGFSNVFLVFRWDGASALEILGSTHPGNAHTQRSTNVLEMRSPQRLIAINLAHVCDLAKRVTSTTLIARDFLLL